MRDLLTVLAGLVIVALAAALAAPPFVDWESQREWVDRALSRAVGTEARTEGRLRVSLLPSPRLVADHLLLGASPNEPSLDAHFLKAEIALAPLLGGEIVFTQARVGRIELKLPTAPDGSWALPVGKGGALRREVAFEDLFAAQAVVTVQSPATGRTDQFRAESVQVESRSLAGPWRIEGQTAGVPFRLATGELSEDGILPAKLTGGGDPLPRFDIDAQVALVQGLDAPAASGTAKVLLGSPSPAPAAGQPVPVTARATFKTSGSEILLDPVSVEAGEGGGLLRLTGSGRLFPEDARLALKLDGRRFDLDRVLALARTWRERAATLPLAPTVDLDLSLGSVAVAGEELSDLKVRASGANGRVRVEDLRFAAGDARVTAQGEVGTASDEPISGRVAVTAASSDRLARLFAGVNGGAAFAAFLDGRPLDAAADVRLETAAVSLRNAWVKVGDATLAGDARYTAPNGGGRGRLEAQLSARAIDLARLPPGQSAFDVVRDLDLSLTLDALDIRYGDGPGAGRVTARIGSDGPALRVELLEVADLAGANAQVSGRIGADGSGRIEGRLNARRAAPLVDLLGGAGAGSAAKLVPSFLREGDLDVSLSAERAAPDPRSGTPALSTILRGRAAGGPFQADLRTTAGRTDRFALRLETANTGLWLGRTDGVLRRPSSLDLRGTRGRSGLLDLTVSGDIGGVRITTSQPFALGAADDTIESGELTVAAADLGPFLPLLGEGAAVPGPVPADGRLKLDRVGDAPRFQWSGRVLGAGAEADLAFRPDGAVDGTVSLERLSLPWLASALALDRPVDPRSGASWSTTRFGRAGRAPAIGQASFKVARLDLGRGLLAESAAFGLNLNADGLSLRDFDAGYAGGRLSGQITIARQEGLASFVGEGRLRDASLPLLLGPSPFDGRLGADLKFGASGESLAGVVANLAGSGEVRLTDVRFSNGDPGALERALPRVLNESDPLSRPRLEALVAEELGRGPLLFPSALAPASLVGGTLRFGPLIATTPGGTWQGSASLDFKTLSLDANGLLAARSGPKGWSGPPPSVLLAWRGPVAQPSRSVDVGPVLNGLAALVLQRELDKIEAFEIEANERARFKGRLDYERDLRDRERRAAEDARRAAEDAARQARLAAEDEARRARQAADEAARRQTEENRQARIREQQAVEEARQARLREQRAAAEEARQRVREQAEAERARTAPFLPLLPGPIEIRPAPPIGRGPGG